MAPVLNKGQLIKWKDDKGFGFIKPNNGGKEVFLHISALKEALRRPKVGDTILYEQVIQLDGKVCAKQASIQGVTTRSFSTKKKSRKRGLGETVVSILILAVIALLTMVFRGSRVPLPISAITQPGCNIKGNIAMNTGKKLYHLPGMEDYESTVIDIAKGERWFCTELDAIKNGWQKAPR